MEYSLDEIATLHMGQILTRVREETDRTVAAYPIYLGEHFLKDANEEIDTLPIEEKYIRTSQPVLTTNVGNLIISLITNRAAIVSERHSGYLLTSNYVIVDYDKSKVDPDYFCYQFNESDEIRKQIALSIQGATLVSRLSLQKMRKFKMYLPSIEEQRKIGKIYCLQKIKELLQHEKIRLEKLAIQERLKNYLQGRTEE